MGVGHVSDQNAGRDLTNTYTLLHCLTCTPRQIVAGGKFVQNQLRSRLPLLQTTALAGKLTFGDPFLDSGVAAPRGLKWVFNSSVVEAGAADDAWRGGSRAQGPVCRASLLGNPSLLPLFLSLARSLFLALSLSLSLCVCVCRAVALCWATTLT